MPELVLWDNDIAFKMACYQLAERAIATHTDASIPPAMLAVGQHVIRQKLARHARVRDISAAQLAFKHLVQTITSIEPTECEVELASDIERQAARASLDLDIGESQLLAILHTRGYHSLITGDKRAIIAISAVAREIALKRIRSLEQLISQITMSTDVAVMRQKICAEPMIDKALSACFGCASGADLSDQDVFDGLNSYIEDLRRKAPDILVDAFQYKSPSAPPEEKLQTVHEELRPD